MPDAASNDASPTSRRSPARTAHDAPATPAPSDSSFGVAGWMVIGVVLVLGALVFDSLYALLDHVHYADMVAALQATPRSHLLLAMLATALSYVALTGYDASGLRYAAAHVAPATVATTSFIAYALGNTVGLGSLTAGAVRTRLYTAAGLDPARVTEAVAFDAGALGVSTTAFGAVGLLWGAPHIAAIAHLPAALLEVVALLVLAGVVALLVLCMRRRHVTLFGRWEIRLPPAGLAARQFAISAADMSAAAAALWVLMPAGAVDLPTFVAFYALAVTLGVLSQSPGGLGVFEAVILLGCSGQAPPAEVLAALLFYRAIYFLLPLVVAAAMLGVFELRSGAGAPFGRAAVKLSPGLLAALTMVAGVMLLVSGVTPATDEAEDLLRMHVPLFVVEASHMIGSVAGLIMLFVARGLLHRLDAAWWAALVLSLLTGVLALPKGIAVSEMAVLVTLAVLLVISRRQFDRPSSLFSQRLEAGWLLAMLCVFAACVWILFFAYREVAYANQLWWQFTFDGDAPRSIRALMAVAVTGLGFGMRQLFRKEPGVTTFPSDEELARAAEIIRKQPAADATLALMGDKSLLFSPSGNAFIMYAKQGRSWVALSDPVGAQQEWPELIWRFIEMADAHGGRAAFYKTRPQTLSLYLDAGLRAYKLGEEAYVSLPEFSLKGSRRANLRHGVTRGEREGLSFEIVPTAEVPTVLDELRAISDEWLRNQNAREKGFSLGAFDDRYICSQPVAVVRREGVILAFATLMCPDVLRIEASVDLMRYRSNVPPGTMDFLFGKVILHFQAQGYQRFGLGMAPMSGMVEHQLAPRWHRFGRMMFRHGARFYNFRGLRNFKDKFEPVWEARYLLARGGIAPLFTLTDVAALIGGGLKGVISK
ncbi:bifunctional lysylphosphatidylglycerol flippase/synthetase MprF [Ralstonia wenshanensis]|uniref:bifunctional lysylphosphatidylglycerol flippase/synthetase MprF n=1 Tax=Ralstonia wenshanensis TaxID=2842456 RepID=UPI002AAD1415|nr:bifunctional lysylphosphatidylglycerol flippase/synthetase MprF [Ralstonia wenshanensis]MDY7509527.1 bifunctional lysylphosphatidylglycerol flippase/synthetase MprF [Ralstonia wenshanensis]